jgi:hypothetical protein
MWIFPLRKIEIISLLTPDKEKDSHARGHLFIFLFHLFSFHLFTAIVTRALLLGTIKGEVGATSMRTPDENTIR